MLMYTGCCQILNQQIPASGENMASRLQEIHMRVILIEELGRGIWRIKNFYRA